MAREAAVESLRWRMGRFGFATPEEFETRRKQPWITEGTRNHGTWDRGIQREERDNAKSLEIEDEDLETARSLVVGRTIVGFDREADSGVGWSDGENSVTITLDDGSQLHFVGWGYDASGLMTTYEPSATPQQEEPPSGS